MSKSVVENSGPDFGLTVLHADHGPRTREGVMAKCEHCGTDTSLYVNGKPVCSKCDAEANQRMREREQNHGSRTPERSSGSGSR
jgi:hypothetical protein